MIIKQANLLSALTHLRAALSTLAEYDAFSFTGEVVEQLEEVETLLNEANEPEPPKPTRKPLPKSVFNNPLVASWNDPNGNGFVNLIRLKNPRAGGIRFVVYDGMGTELSGMFCYYCTAKQRIAKILGSVWALTPTGNYFPEIGIMEDKPWSERLSEGLPKVEMNEP